MSTLLALLLAAPCGADPVPGVSRVIEVGPGGTLLELGPRRVPVAAPTAAPIPVGWVRPRLALSRGETVVIRSADGRKIKTVTVDKDGIVEIRPLSPTQVQVMGVETGIAWLTVETE
jgi:hypothetical protein